MKMISHHQVVSVKDVFATATKIFIVLELVEGSLHPPHQSLSLTNISPQVVNYLIRLPMKESYPKNTRDFTSNNSSMVSNIVT
jgi:hypothetical protein